MRINSTRQFELRCYRDVVFSWSMTDTRMLGRRFESVYEFSLRSARKFHWHAREKNSVISFAVNFGGQPGLVKDRQQPSQDRRKMFPRLRLFWTHPICVPNVFFFFFSRYFIGFQSRQLIRRFSELYLRSKGVPPLSDSSPKLSFVTF